MDRRSKLYPLSLLALVAAVFTWSAISPADRLTWWLEVTPAIIGAMVLIALYSRFEFSNLVMALIAIHMIVLLIGGHYTYAQVPWFNWLRDEFGLARNHYDRVAHFIQGFVPALVARELLVRTSPLGRSRWLAPLVVMACLAISAMYELIEWLTAEWTGSAAEAFLGTQGDPWDTQKDMALALVGAISAVLLLSRWHDRQLQPLLTRP